jgi:hypothetical protein
MTDYYNSKTVIIRQQGLRPEELEILIFRKIDTL